MRVALAGRLQGASRATVGSACVPHMGPLADSRDRFRLQLPECDDLRFDAVASLESSSTQFSEVTPVRCGLILSPGHAANSIARPSRRRSAQSRPISCAALARLLWHRAGHRSAVRSVPPACASGGPGPSGDAVSQVSLHALTRAASWKCCWPSSLVVSSFSSSGLMRSSPDGESLPVSSSVVVPSGSAAGTAGMVAEGTAPGVVLMHPPASY